MFSSWPDTVIFTLSRFKFLQVDQGSSLLLAKCLIGMIPLSRHSVDLSTRAFHSSTHNMVRTSCFDMLCASAESRQLFLDGSLAWQGFGHGVDVSDDLLGGRDLRWYCLVLCTVQHSYGAPMESNGQGWQPFAVCVEGLYPPVHTSSVLEYH